MPAHRDQPPRARTLPDGVVFWLGAAWLALSAAARLGREVDAAVASFAMQRLWPAVVRFAHEAERQVAGMLTRARRSAPTWLAERRTRVALWAASAEVIIRRGLTTAWTTGRSSAAAGIGAPAFRRWSRRAARVGAVGAALALGLVVGSDPLLSGLARLMVGDDVEGELRPLAQSSVVVGGEGTPLGIVEEERRKLVDADTLPEHVTALVLAAEDRRFEDHEGYDLAGLARAAATNARAGEVEQGGSTITQQLAKLNFTGDDPSVRRKVEELLYAVRLEDELSKEQLLQRYLNQIYFGNGAHGIAAAAEEYFATEPQDLSVAQAAVLAGIIQAPSALDPRRNPEDARRRRDAVLRSAADHGLVDPAESAAAAAEPLHVAEDATRSRTDPIIDAVRAEVRDIEALGATPRERLERLETGGLRVETTLDPTLQHVVATAIDATVAAGAGPTAAVAAVDPESGAIRALRGGYEGPGGFDLARQGRRQPGSTFKPLTAVAALEAGLSPRQRLAGNGPIELDHGGPEPWRVDNFEGSDAGSVDLADALRRSVNTAFAQLGTAVGVEAMTDVVGRVGIDVPAALGDPDQRGPSMALGGVAHGVSPLELAGAYTVFANDGEVATPYLVQRIVDSDGTVLHERKPRTRAAVEEPIASRVRSMLEAALASGTGRAARIDGVAAFGKTGTSQDGADAWFVGSTSNLTTAVWVGHAASRVPMPEATGGTLAAPIWGQVTTAWVEAHPPEAWPRPDSPLRAPGLELPRPERADP